MAIKHEQNQLLTQATRTLFYFLGIFALTLVIFDSGNLLPKDAVVDRWTALFIVFIVNTIAWFIGSQGTLYSKKILTFLLGLVLLGFAGATTYWERGMASTSTILYVLPLLVVATLKNRHALLAATLLAIGTYALATVTYFNNYFNEGYRIQLWGSIVLYSGSMLVVAWLIMVLTGLRKDSR
jgi:hypothetical protein